MKLPIVIDGKVVGVVEDGSFKKHLRSEHFLRKPPAICFDVCSLDDAEKAGAQRVMIHEENGQIHIALIPLIRRFGFKVNRGHGEQIGLSLGRWRETVMDAEDYYASTLDSTNTKKSKQPEFRF